mgnify:CR=1 FL=1
MFSLRVLSVTPTTYADARVSELKETAMQLKDTQLFRQQAYIDGQWLDGTLGRYPTTVLGSVAAERFGDEGDAIRILYGGSVKPGNAAEIFAIPNVDGGLIGGASLKAADFLAICDGIGG